MPISKYPPHELHPRKLSGEEAADPNLVIEDLFIYAHLPELRAMLWLWFKTTVAGNYSKTCTREERQAIVCVYEHMEKLLEAAHIIYTKHRNNPKLQ